MITKTILPTLVTIVIGATSVYFFYDRNFVAGVLALLWSVSRMFDVKLQRALQGSETGNFILLERECNVFIQLELDILEILQHPFLGDLFEKLQQHKATKWTTKNEWMSGLVDNFKRKYPQHEEWTHEGLHYLRTSVRFNLKGGLLWKNNLHFGLESVCRKAGTVYLSGLLGRDAIGINFQKRTATLTGPFYKWIGIPPRNRVLSNPQEGVKFSATRLLG